MTDNQPTGQLTTCVVQLTTGAITVTCEKLNDWLAITPAVGRLNDAGDAGFFGGYVLTHIPTGVMFSDGAACLTCCRSGAEVILSLDIDMSEVTKDNVKTYLEDLPTETRRRLLDAKMIAWACDSLDYCEPWATSEVTGGAA